MTDRQLAGSGKVDPGFSGHTSNGAGGKRAAGAAASGPQTGRCREAQQSGGGTPASGRSGRNA